MSGSTLPFFDCNCMIGRWPAYPRFQEIRSATDLIRELDYFGIDKSLVFHSLAWTNDSLVGNKMLSKEIQGAQRLYPAWVVNTDHGKVLDTATLREFGVHAIRMFFQGSGRSEDGFILSNLMVGEIFERLNKMRIPVFLHLAEPHLDAITSMGDPTYEWVPDYYWDKIYELAKQYSDLPIILTRVASYQHTILRQLLRKTDNVYWELSGSQKYNGIEDLVSTCGAERILFGTWLPFADPGYSIAKVVYADINTNDKELISHLNIERLLGAVQFD